MQSKKLRHLSSAHRNPIPDIGAFLSLAARIAAALAECHRQGFPYGNVTPQNILVSSETGAIVLVNPFSGQRPSCPDAMFSPLTGTEQPLAYIPPEQIRRLHQGIDSRADLYSLGVVFYELLTGCLPFSATDPLGWAHCHIARLPKSPSEIEDRIPAPVSDMVMKLLSKAAEDRYQSAGGLQRDLEQCLRQWQTQGDLAPFVLGAADTSEQLCIPHRLYGREQEIEALRQSFERVAGNGDPELVLVAGYSGIGKTSLVRELYKPVFRRQGHFIWGKFDQYKKNIPYATIIEAFETLIRQILTEREEILAGWRIRLGSALGINGQLIVDIIPQLEHIIGKQQPVADLPMNEAENRFKTIFCRFMGVFADEHHPLVLFLDDLQWADSASLGLVEHILSDPQTRFLLLIGAYRDNEVDSAHPLSARLAAIRATGCPVATIRLQPLSFAHLRHLLADTFHSGLPVVDSLARLVHEKTGGNAFFAIQFLRTLHGEHLVEIDKGAWEWSWDIEAIRTKGYADNVVDLMVGNLRKLRPETQHVLSIASCIGNTFPLAVLASVHHCPEQAMQDLLREAIQVGLVFPGLTGATYTFLHDRVQQSAYSLIPPGQRPAKHRNIGRLMLAATPAELVEERIFDIVNQFHLGKDEITGRNERFRVAELCLIAGRKATISSAYEPALAYFALGAGFMDATGWASHYRLMYDLHRELAVALYVNSNYVDSQRQIATLLEQARSNVERAELYNILIVQYTLTGRYNDAIRTGQEALALLHVHISLTHLAEELEEQFVRYTEILGARSIDSLAEEPEMTDPENRIALELLANMVVPARYTDNTMFALIGLHNVNLSLQFGPTPKSTVGYTAFGMYLNSALNRYQEAYAFGELSLKLCERFNAPAQKCQACFMLGHYLSHWVRPLLFSDVFNEQGIEAGLASGERQWLGYILAYKLFQPFYRGERLATLLAAIPDLLSFTGKTRNRWASDTLLGLRLALTALEQENDDDLLAASAQESAAIPGEDEYIASCQAHRSFGALGRYYVLKVQILLLYGRFAEARQAIDSARSMLDYFSSSISVVALNFYSSLVLAASFTEADRPERCEILTTLERNQTQLRLWTEQCPENFGHLHTLVEAEAARLAGKEFAAGRLYDQAVREAAHQGFLQDEGLANEAAGRFYLLNGLDAIAETYLRKARDCYSRWQAGGKVRQMETLYPGLKKGGLAVNSSEWELDAGALDTLAVVKASQAISGEIVITDLVHILMQTVLENAGAQRGYLVCERDSTLVIEAEAWIEDGGIRVRQPKTGLLVDETALPVSIFNYVKRSHDRVILDDAAEDNSYSTDAYLARTKPVSLLCLPVMRQARLIGMLYLENNLMKGAFSPQQIATLELLAAQAAISLENAALYQEQRRAEDALRESEEKYRTIFDNSGTVLAFIEDDMTIAMANKEFEILTGYRKDDVEGRLKWTALVADPDDLERMTRYHMLRRINPGAAPQTYECRLHGPGGTTFDAMATVTMLPGTRQSLAAILDISERKQAEEKHLRLATAIEQTTEAVFITDPNFTICYANPAFERMCGYDRREIVGLHARILENRKHDRQFYRALRTTLEQGKGWSGRMTCTRKDGSTYEAEVVSSPVRDKHGKVINYVSTHKDVTHELRLEEELRQAQKMEAIGTLAGGIAHDFNNILAAIMGNAELLQCRLPPESGEQRRLHQLLASCNRAADLVQQILTFSRKSKQERKPLRLTPIVKETLKLLRSTIPSHIAIRTSFSCQPDADLTLADPTQMHQILMNLCTNAAHAIGAANGVMEIVLSSLVVDEPLIASRFAGLVPGRYVCLAVSDTGPGIEPEVLQRIFDPYFTTKGVGKGTGLGLAVVKGIVTSYSGSITVTCEPGLGTTFTLLFPQEEAIAEAPAPAPKPWSSGRGRILLVDDEEMLVQVGSEMLASLGYEVVGKTSSPEALELFLRHPDTFDLVLTDMTMPGMTGKELAGKILATRPRMPVVLCTGFSDFISEQQIESLGIRAFVPKPYTLETLGQAVRSALRTI